MRLSKRLVGLILLLFYLIFYMFMIVLGVYQLIEELRSIAYPVEPPDLWVFPALALVCEIVLSIMVYVVIVEIRRESYRAGPGLAGGRLV